MISNEPFDIRIYKKKEGQEEGSSPAYI
jgi:hypothetical protein